MLNLGPPNSIGPGGPPPPGASGPALRIGATSLGVADILLLVMAVGVVGAGFWLLSRARRTPIGQTCTPALPLVGPVRRSSMYSLALGVIVLGYHIGAWTLPAVLPLHVPGRRWWVVPIVLALVIAGTLWAERMERDPHP